MSFKVGWILSGGEDLGSARITAINVHKYLVDNSLLDSHILYQPQSASNTVDISKAEVNRIVKLGCDLLIFQKVQHGAVSTLIEEAHKRGTKTIFMMCDCLEDIVFSAVDAIMVFSDYHKEHLLSYKEKTHVVFSAYESPFALCKQHFPVEVLQIGSFGSQCSSFPRWIMKCIKHVGGTPVGIGFSTKIERRLEEMSGRYMRWHANTIFANLLTCDIGVIFANEDEHLSAYKSMNRPLQLMALGVPVIVSPLPSYEKLIVHGENGFIARERRDWRKYMDRLKSVEYRQRLATQARQDVLEKFSIDKQVAAYITVFEKVLSE